MFSKIVNDTGILKDKMICEVCYVTSLSNKILITSHVKIRFVVHQV